MHLRILLALTFGVCLIAPAQSQTREELVRNDKAKVEAAGFWIYNDLPRAFAEAERTGKPIVVVLRCIPCHECVKLDDELVDTDPVIRPLLEKFVCVRIVGTNGLDLNVFQYDTDQSFAVFFLNADRTIYGRFGTRSHRTEWVGDVSLDGLAKALQGALDLHSRFNDTKESLAGKRGTPLEVASPEQFPSLKGEYTNRLNYEGNVVKSCIHCHQIGDAQREYYWQDRKPIPEKVLFPYPHPKTVGLVLDPDERATIKEVTSPSPASLAGLEAGDQILSMNGQPLLSIADTQWVLHQVAPEGGRISLVIQRGDQKLDRSLELKPGWRREGDLSWRATTWGLRRIALGGLQLETLTEAEKKESGLQTADMAMIVKHAGKYGPHAAAHNLGIREGDILVSFDGNRTLQREQDVIAHVVMNKQVGDEVEIEMMRGRTRTKYRIPVQP